jgi:V/A-type H+-transporting ATPase subunit A
MIREDFLQQSAYHEVDSFCTLEKQYWMLRAILRFHEKLAEAMGRGVALEKLLRLPIKARIGRMKEDPDLARVKGLVDEIDKEVAPLEVEA